MLKAADLFSRICSLLSQARYTAWTNIWDDYSSLVTLNRPIQKGDVISLKHEITEAHKWVERNSKLNRSFKQELLILLGLSGRVTRMTNISKVNDQKNQDGLLIERYQALIGYAKPQPSNSNKVTLGGANRLIASPPKSKKTQFVRAATPKRATKATRKGTSRKMVVSSKFRS